MPARRSAKTGRFTSTRHTATRRSSSRRRAGREVDTEAVRELSLYAENDGDLYRQRYLPIVDNLLKKKVRGVYDAKKAVTWWRYFADAAAQKYTNEFGSRGGSSYGTFTVADRDAYAHELARDFDRMVANGKWDNRMPKPAKRPAKKRAAATRTAGRRRARRTDCATCGHDKTLHLASGHHPCRDCACGAYRAPAKGSRKASPKRAAGRRVAKRPAKKRAKKRAKTTRRAARHCGY